VNSVMNLRVPKNAGKLPSGYTTCVLSTGTELHRVSLDCGVLRPPRFMFQGVVRNGSGRIWWKVWRRYTN
jgi:hypothetical protein